MAVKRQQRERVLSTTPGPPSRAGGGAAHAVGGTVTLRAELKRGVFASVQTYSSYKRQSSYVN